MGCTPLWLADLVPALRQWLAAHPVGARVVLVPSRRVGAALRRALTGDGALCGVQFTTAADLAAETLRRAGVAFEVEDGAARALRLEWLLQSDRFRGRLAYFRLERLREGDGYARAIARTLGELESAGLSPQVLRDLADGCERVLPGRVRDLAALWEAVAAGDPGPARWTIARVFHEAAVGVARQAGAVPPASARAAVLFDAPAADLAGFLRALPDLEVFRVGARPEPSEAPAAVAAWLGDGRGPAALPPPTGHDELDRLVYPDRAGDRAAVPPDGSVHLDRFAGVEAEIDAAAAWVAEQVLVHRTPLDRIAVLTPELDPWCALVYERLQRLPWGGDGAGGDPPVFVACGLPVTALPAGQRCGTLLGALEACLSAQRLSELLPFLKVDAIAGDAERIPLTRARELLYGCGTLGGDPARPAAHAEWLPALAARRLVLDRLLAEPRPDVEEGDDRAVREHAALVRERADLVRAQPVIELLVTLCGRLLADRPLTEIWRALEPLVRERLVLPGEPRDLPARLAGMVQGWCDAGLGESLRGMRALQALRDGLAGMRVATRSFGHPAVYVGTIHGAVGLAFDAVRVIGLAEGVFPRQPAEDAILPDEDREAVEQVWARRAGASSGRLPRRRDRVAADRRALHRVLQGVTQRVVLSAPGETLDRSEHEPSPTLFEAAAALGRHPADQGPVPDRAALHRHYLVPARQARPAGRHLAALRPVWLARALAERADGQVPAALLPELARTADRVRAAAGNDCDPVHGWLPTDLGAVAVPGLTPARAISASRLNTLVTCPHLFLLSALLHWQEPFRAPTGRDVDALSWGRLMHHVQERFLREHGAAFVARKGKLASHLVAAERIAEDEFARARTELLLIGEAVQQAKLEQLRREFRGVLEREWHERTQPGTHVAVEYAFGFGSPLAIGTPPLYMHGYIDRIDEINGKRMVRDLKTGRPHPRQEPEAEPNPGIDLQIGVYALALEAERAGAPVGGAAYVYTRERESSERAFEADYAALRTATLGWLKLAETLLRAGAFPRTPDREACTWCAFHSQCGARPLPAVDAAPERQRAALAGLVELYPAPEAEEGDEV